MTAEEVPPFEEDAPLAARGGDPTVPPLEPLRVVELASGVAGPFCGKLLADFGADVIKIEQPGQGDAARRYRYERDEKADPERSALFLYLNTNKRGIALDVTSPEGREVLFDLLTDADVLIEDWTHDEVQAAGLDHASLRERFPSLIVTSVTPWGRTGPFRDYRAHPMNTFHASGQGFLLPMNSPDTSREPVKGGGLVGEYDAGMASGIATLAALFWRNAGGTGQHIDISKQHAVMHLEKSQLRRYVDDGVSPDRTGMGRLLETIVTGKDGNHVVIILSSQHQWKGLFEAMGSPEWGANPPFDTQAGRSEHYPELREHLQTWAAQYTAEDIFHKIQACRSAAAPVYLAEHFLASPQVAARNFLLDLDHPVAGPLQYPGRPFQFSNVSWQGQHPAPLLGQHTDDILFDLGYPHTRLSALKDAGVVQGKD